MTGQELWELFRRETGLEDRPYEAWAFGSEPDELARLVVSGIKTATASAYPLYELEQEPLPQAGEYSVILDGKDSAVCVIRNQKVTVVPYCRIGAEHARKEGEGDRSLEYWQRVHEAFFSEEMARAGLVFTPDMPVVCEEFCVVYKP